MAFTFLIFPPSPAFAEFRDLSRYSSLIASTLLDDGADCGIESFSLTAKTKLNSVFLIKCSKSSYLNEVEITCKLSPEDLCEVSRY